MMLMICKAIRWGAMFDEYDIFSPPSFDVQICYNDCMHPIYDEYIDESGLGRVSTLGNDPTILEGVESYCCKRTLHMANYHPN